MPLFKKKNGSFTEVTIEKKTFNIEYLYSLI